jgi:hypothetical protein
VDSTLQLAKNGHMQEALAAFEKKPTLHSASYLISRQPNAREGLKIYNTLIHHKIQVDAPVYKALLCTCKKQGEFNIVMTLWPDMCDSNIKYDPLILKIVAEAAAKKDNVQAAKDVMTKIKSTDVQVRLELIRTNIYR